MDQKLLRKYIVELASFFAKEPGKITSIQTRDYKNILKGLEILISANPADYGFTSLSDGFTNLKYKNENGLLHVIDSEITNAKDLETISHQQVLDILRTYSLVLNDKNKIDLDLEKWH